MIAPNGLAWLFCFLAGQVATGGWCRRQSCGVRVCVCVCVLAAITGDMVTITNMVIVITEAAYSVC